MNKIFLLMLLVPSIANAAAAPTKEDRDKALKEERDKTIKAQEDLKKLAPRQQTKEEIEAAIVQFKKWLDKLGSSYEQLEDDEPLKTRRD